MRVKIAKCRQVRSDPLSPNLEYLRTITHQQALHCYLQVDLGGGGNNTTDFFRIPPGRY